MANLDFPSSPTNGQEHSVNGKTWVWNGVAWTVKRLSLPGKSAYELAIEQGFVGTEAQWIASLKGPKGDTGEIGPKGDAGARGEKGDTGDRGADGTDGIDGTNGVGVPTGGSQGQVLTKRSATPYDTHWVTPDYLSDYTVPLGGEEGQFLGKVTGADGNFAWIDLPDVAPYDPELPLGGNQGQVLTKASTASGDVIWADPAGGSSVPDGGTTGQILTKISSFNGDAGWRDASFPEEAPSDGKTYGRKNGEWSEVTAASGGGIINNYPSSTRWRVIINANNGGAVTGFSEIDIENQTNSSIRSIAAVSASSNNGAGFIAIRATDGQIDTAWLSGPLTGDATPWYEFNFSVARYIKTLKINRGTIDTAGYMPRNFKLQYYDGQLWVDTISVTNSTSWNSNETRTFTDDNDYSQASDSPPWPPVSAVGTGSSQNITLPVSVANDYDINVYVNGLHLPIDQYSVNDFLVTLTTNAAGDNIEIRPAPGIRTVTGDNSVSYPPMTNNAGKLLAVNLQEDGVEWVDAPEGTGGGTGEADPYYRMAGFFTTSPAVNEILMIYVVDVPVTIPANFSGSQARLIGMQPGSNFVLSIRKNSTTEIGTVSVNTAGEVTFATTDGTAKPLLVGDAISIHAPGVSDTISNLTWILRGNK